MVFEPRKNGTMGWSGPIRLLALAGLMLADPVSSALAQAPDPKNPTPNDKEDRARRMAPSRPAVKPAGTPGAPPTATPVPGTPPNVPPAMAPGTGPAGKPGAPSPGPAVITLPHGGAEVDTHAQMTDKSLKVGPLDNVEVRLLVDLVASALNLQVMDTGQALADKRVSLLTQIEIPRERLLDFLALMLEQNGQMMVRDSVSGIFMIRPVGEFTGPIGSEEGSTTRLIPTPGVRPSSLQQAIQIGIRPSTNPAAGSLAQPLQLAFLDDLGVILVTDTPRRMKQLESLVNELCRQQASQKWVRLPLKYLSASIARTRVLELMGITVQRTGIAGVGGPINPETGQPIGQPVQPGATASIGGSLSSLSQRLTIDPQGNDLLLKGTDAEGALVRSALTIVDVPSRLVGKYYHVGGQAQTIASQGKAQGLGEVVTLQSNQNQTLGPDGRPVPNLGVAAAALTGQTQENLQGGPRFVIDPENRGFTYFGTPEQQAQLDALIAGLEPLLISDEIVYEFYRLQNAKAEKVAEVIRGLLTNQAPAAGSGSALLPGGNSTLGGRSTRGSGAPREFRSPLLNPSRTEARTPAQNSGATTGDTSAIDASADIFVLEYTDTNTILVKAPRRLQPQFRQLISRLDIRRPQVYIDARIMIVTGSDEQRLAVETQLINASGKGGVLRTLFTPSPTVTGTVTGNITIPAAVTPLTGITAAIINSDMVPVVITAIATTTNARIVASPKLLVDDNVEATILSKEERPTQTQVSNSGSGGTTTGFGGFEEAGPELTVKPQISAGGYIRLEYSLNLSAFIGEASSAFTPPPRQTNEIKSESVTIPSDTTIVVGGLTFDQKRKTVVKVPLLGDIPIIGQAFRDERDNVSTSTIYVFITPRIMRDEDFDDLRLLTKGPMAALEMPESLPPPQLMPVDITAPLLPPPEATDSGGPPPAPSSPPAPPPSGG